MNTVISSPARSVYTTSDVISNTACIFIGQGCRCCSNIFPAPALSQASIQLKPFHLSTMQLLDLPPELLVNTLKFVGPDHFREDVRNVAISKVWYEFARPVLLSCIHLSTSTLRAGFLRSLKNASTLAAVQHYTSSVNIRLDIPKADGFSDEQHVGGVSHSDPSPTQAGIDLQKLGRVLRGFPQLRSLRIYPGQHELRVESFALSTLVSLQPGLTSLDIDLANVRFTDDESRSHMCKSISALMPSLVHLRCRLPYIVRTLLQ